MNRETDFPTLRRNADGLDYRSVTLPLWAGFGEIVLSEPTSRKTEREQCDPATGKIEVSLGEGKPEGAPLIVEEQKRAFQYTIENAEEIQKILLAEAFSYYCPLREKILSDDPEYANDYMPPLRTAKELTPLIFLRDIVFFYVQKDGISYVGYNFKTDWEPEHGMGFLTHKNRVIEAGLGDVAVNAWVAKKDMENDGSTK